MTESLLNLHNLTHIIQKMLTEWYMTDYLSKNGNIALKQVKVHSFVTYCEDLLLYNMVKYGDQELRHFTDILNPTARILLYNHHSDVIFC
jgi:hypothetical protein